VKIGFSSPIINVWALIAIRAAEMRCNPISGIDMLDGKALADNETDVVVQVPPAVHVQLGPEEISLAGSVVRDDVLAAGEGRS
jgi:hypothetical protein